MRCDVELPASYVWTRFFYRGFIQYVACNTVCYSASVMRRQASSAGSANIILFMRATRLHTTRNNCDELVTQSIECIPRPASMTKQAVSVRKQQRDAP